MPTSEYKDEEVEEMYDKIEEILEEDGKGETNTITLGDCNGVIGDKSYKIFAGPHGRGRINHRCQMDLLPPVHGLRNKRHDCTPGKHQVYKTNIWTIYL